jgi:TonB family protein
MTLLLTSTIKASLILLFALGATALLRNRPAAIRHLVLSAAVICAAALPAVEWVVPTWHVRLGTSSLARVEQRQEQLTAAETQPQAVSGAVGLDGLASVRPLLSGNLPGTVWIAGVAISLFMLLVGLGRLAWIASRAQRVVHGPWTELTREIASTYALRRPVLLLQSDHPTMLVTWGVVRPRVILPCSARDWSEDRARVVISHELAHILRGDWAIQMAAEILRSVYWFNPLVWIACRRLRQDSERACDDAVLNLGIDASEYATHLLDLARVFASGRRMRLPAPEMARPSSLEGRIRAMLNARINRQPTTRSAGLLTIVAISAVTVSIAAAQTFATLSGSVVDPTNGVLPEVTLVLTNVESRAKHEVRTDRTGHFEFVGLPRGDYALEAQLPGFATLRGTVTVAGQNVQRDMTLEVGSLQETITIIGGRSDNEAPRAPDPRVEQFREQRRLQFRSTCGNAPSGGNVGGNLGGNLRLPAKLKDVKPRYPRHLWEANIGGTVFLEGRIGTDGSFSELWAVTPLAHPDLEAAALEAARQWQFDEMLLNGCPVEAPVKITANFKIQQ